MLNLVPQNTPKHTIWRSKNSKISGPSPSREGDTPTPHLTPSAPSAPRFTGLRPSTWPLQCKIASAGKPSVHVYVKDGRRRDATVIERWNLQVFQSVIDVGRCLKVIGPATGSHQLIYNSRSRLQPPCSRRSPEAPQHTACL